MRDITTEDVEELFSWDQPGWEAQYTQLTAGGLGFRSTLIDLGGVTIQWNRFERGMRLSECRQKGGFCFAWLLDASDQVSFGSNPIGNDTGFVYLPGETNDHLSKGGFKVLAIDVPEQFAKSFGSLRQIQRISIDPILARTFVNYCRGLSDRLRRQMPTSVEIERSKLLGHLRSVMDPWCNPRTDAEEAVVHHQGNSLFARAEANMADILDAHAVMSVKELADSLGASERTLFRSFGSVVGMGPFEYFQLIRLHRFRDKLLSFETERGAVSRAAREVGFDHLSRLSSLYKRHFGELPRETIRRKAGRG